MNAIGVMLLAAATAGDGLGYSKPDVGFKKFLRHGVVSHGAPPAGGMMAPSGPSGGPGSAGAQANGRRFPNVRSQIFFLDPNGMHIGWQTGATNGERVYLPAQLTVPARFNFMQGYIYRLKLSEIPGRPNVLLYPTLEVAPSAPATDAYLTHNPIPVQFTAEDFDQVVDGGNFVTKVIYLPDPKYQELAIAGVETLVSTRLEPGVDPILEADKRGTILLIVRLGAIDLEMPSNSGGSVVSGSPAINGGTTIVPANALPPGMVPTPPTSTLTVPVDSAPVSPALAPAVITPPAPTPPVPSAEPPVAVPTPPAVEAPAPPAVEAPVPPAVEVPAPPAVEVPKS